MANVEAVEIMDTESGNTVRWGAIFVGAVIGLAVTVALVILGLGVGLALYNPWGPIGSEARQLSLGAVIWLCTAQLWGLFVGGYATGWLIDRDFYATSHERRIRNALHGGAVWGLALLVGTLMSAALAISTLSATARVVAGAGVAAGGAAVASGGVDEGLIGSLSREMLLADTAKPVTQAPAQTPAPNAPAPAAVADSTADGPSGARLNDFAPVLRRGWASGELAGSERKYLSQAISRSTGLSEVEADKRVAAAENQMREASIKAKQLADQARKAGAFTAFWSFVALLLGAVGAAGGAMCGGAAHLREDETAAGIVLR